MSKISKNILWMFLANLLDAFIKWLTLITIIKLLTLEEVGLYTFAFALTAPIILFSNMKMRAVYLTETTEKYSSFYGARIFMNVLVFIFLIIIGGLFYSNYLIPIVLISLWKIMDLQSDIYYSLPHKSMDLVFVSKLMIVKTLIVFLSFVIGILLSGDLNITLSIQLIVTIIITFYQKNKIFKKYKVQINFQFQDIKMVLLYCIPLGVTQLIVSLNTNVSRYILEYFENVESVAVFSGISYLLVISNVFMNSIAQIFIPFLKNKVERKKYKEFNKLLFIQFPLLIISVSILILIITYSFGNNIISLVYNENFASGNLVFILAIAMVFSAFGWLGDIGLIVIRRIKIQPKISFIVLVINIILSLILIKNLGIIGAGYTLVIVNLIQFILRYLVLIKNISKGEFSGET